MRSKFLTIAALVATLAPVALAANVPFDRDWKLQRLSLFSANKYGFGGNSVSVASDGTVSLAYRKLEEAKWGADTATWSWAVQEGVVPTNLSLKGGDDRDLALYFVFLPEVEARAASDANIRELLTNDAARVLVYVWGGDHARGDKLDSPYLGPRGQTIVLRGAGTGANSENVNLAQDYASAFGGDAALVGVAISADSDDTDGRIRATISDLAVN